MSDVLSTLLRIDGRDPGCELCMDRLHVWAEAVNRGETPEPEITRHLHNCVSCAEDAEALLALLKG
jgi:hypothetical protein